MDLGVKIGCVLAPALHKWRMFVGQIGAIAKGGHCQVKNGSDSLGRWKDEMSGGSSEEVSIMLSCVRWLSSRKPRESRSSSLYGCYRDGEEGPKYCRLQQATWQL